MMKNLSVLLFLVLCTLCTKAQVRTEYLFEKDGNLPVKTGQTL